MTHLHSYRALCRGVLILGMASQIYACGSIRHSTTVIIAEDGTRQDRAFVSAYQYEQFLLGERAAAFGAYEEAIAHYRRARAGAADDPWVWARQLQAMIHAGDLEGAQTQLDRAIARYPHEGELFLVRATLLLRHGERTRAIEALSEARRLRGHARGEPEELRLLSPPPPPPTAHAHTQAALDAQQPARALRSLGALSEADPLTLQVLLAAGRREEAARAAAVLNFHTQPSEVQALICQLLAPENSQAPTACAAETLEAQGRTALAAELRAARLSTAAEASSAASGTGP